MSQGRIYSVSFTAVAVTAAVDIFEITPADDKPVEILGMVWGQTTDFGDAQAEQIGIRIIRGFTASGTGGTATTPRPMNRGDAAASFTAETNNTGAATTGTAVDLFCDAMNAQAGYQIWFPEGCEPQATQGDTTLIVRMIAAPADSITTSGTLIVREQG